MSSCFHRFNSVTEVELSLNCEPNIEELFLTLCRQARNCALWWRLFRGDVGSFIAPLVEVNQANISL